MAVQAFFFFFSFSAFLATTILLSSSPPLVLAAPFKYPAVFNFGDSNSDTGGLIASTLGGLHSPNGESYFNGPAGRFCDGRLIIDFFMDSMGLPFVNPYLDSVGVPNFHRGCNFAVAGSTVLRPKGQAVSPFSLGVQVNQFIRFKNKVLQLLGGELDKFIPAEEHDYFKRALYMFDIGQNDLAGAFYSKSEAQVIASIPAILWEFENGVKKLYDQGARNFWIHNTGPLGCIPQNIAFFGKDPKKLDTHGCVSDHNRAAKQFNLQLHALSKKLRSELTDANITYVDVFSIKFDLIANFSRYGFEHPLMVCCGYGGPPLNYDSRISCGETRDFNGTIATTNVCDDTSKYISWDGIHYTEAANFRVFSQILTGKYSDLQNRYKMSIPNIEF